MQKRKAIPIFLRRLCYEIDGHTCVYCGNKPTKPSRHYGLSIDHIIPVSRGGKHVFSNMITACLFCNLMKYKSLDFKERVTCLSSKRKRLLMRWHGISVKRLKGDRKRMAAAMNRRRGSRSKWRLSHHSEIIPLKNGIYTEQIREEKDNRRY